MLGKKKAAKRAEPVVAIKFDKLDLIDGTFTTIVPQSYKDRKGWVRPDERQLFSFIPGTITEISVKVGDEVKVGDKLLMFKAMKMSNTLTAPMDGVIGSIKVEVDQIVPKGVMLLEYK